MKYRQDSIKEDQSIITRDPMRADGAIVRNGWVVDDVRDDITYYMIPMIDVDYLEGEFRKLLTDYDFIDGHRLCPGPDKSERFMGKRTCCGSKEVLVTNPETKRSFWIGINYECLDTIS